MVGNVFFQTSSSYSVRLKETSHQADSQRRVTSTLFLQYFLHDLLPRWKKKKRLDLRPRCPLYEWSMEMDSSEKAINPDFPALDSESVFWLSWCGWAGHFSNSSELAGDELSNIWKTQHVSMSPESRSIYFILYYFIFNLTARWWAGSSSVCIVLCL